MRGRPDTRSWTAAILRRGQRQHTQYSSHEERGDERPDTRSWTAAILWRGQRQHTQYSSQTTAVISSETTAATRRDYSKQEQRLQETRGERLWQQPSVQRPKPRTSHCYKATATHGDIDLPARPHNTHLLSMMERPPHSLITLAIRYTASLSTSSSETQRHHNSKCYLKMIPQLKMSYFKQIKYSKMHIRNGAQN